MTANFNWQLSAFFFGKLPVFVSADYNSRCLPYYCKVSLPKEKIRWLPEYGIKVGHLIEAGRKRYKIIPEKVYKENNFRVSWFVISENTPGVYVL